MARVRLNLYRKEQRLALPRPGRRARRVLAASLITLSLLGVTGVGVTSIVAPQAMAAALKDPSSLLSLRSPGHRGLALLLTKHKKAAPPAAPARERAEAPQESKPEPAPVFALIEPGQDMPPIIYGPEAAVTEQGLPSEAPGLPPGLGGPGGGVTTFEMPPGGGGGGGGCCGATTITEGGGVPEPQVWAMLIAGFFAVGAMMRAQRRARRLAHGVHA
ncbi:MAG TPA: PEPxxWA-CTERM sorting domain-containing protein [Caulobacteraceae bacterium]|nr:PEPxxWA-CTERM sorting domain-containing protein [Caulobacteraceae bacterium]